ncbi:MAG: hypothetical protein AB1483_13045 [Candidatus Zixiibacteriota bacterium]
MKLVAEFNREELFLWAQITSIHPNNQRYQLRLEYLTALLLSLRNETYENRRLLREDFVRVVDLLDCAVEHLLSPVEDWHPFDQLKTIPFVLRGRRYYFFYGIYEKPYELLCKFRDLIFNEGTDGNADALEYEFLGSLNFQTLLIEKLIADGESKEKSEAVYVPSQKFYESFRGDFESASYSQREGEVYELTDFDVTPEQVLARLQTFSLFEKTKVRFDDKCYFLLPQVHLQSFYRSANEFLAGDDAVGLRAAENLRKRFHASGLRHFGLRGYVKSVENQKGQNLATDVDFIAHFDGNILYLFKIVLVLGKTDCVHVVKQTADELYGRIKGVKREATIGLIKWPESIGVPPAELEIHGFVVYAIAGLDFHGTVPMPDETTILSWEDILRLFEVFDSPVSLHKFLRDNRNLELRSRVIAMDYLDKVPYYVQNNCSFPATGVSPTHVLFQPHDWQAFYYSKEYRRLQDPGIIWLLCRYGEKFNRFEESADGIYSFVDTAYLDGGLLVKNTFCEWAIIVYPLNGFLIDGDVVSSYCKLLGPLYADYLQRLKPSLHGLFEERGKDYTNFTLALYPKEIVVKEDGLRHFVPCLERLNSDDPIYVWTGSGGPNVLKSCVFYDPEKLLAKFDSPNNDGERYCILKLYESFLSHLAPLVPEAQRQTQSRAFINKEVRQATKGYSFDAVSVRNPKLRDYGVPISQYNSEIMMVNRSIAKFLREEGVPPGIYKGKGAVDINERIFKFVGQTILLELKDYAAEILPFAYYQAECVEGQRETNYIQRDIDSTKLVQYDFVNEYLKKQEGISELALCSKLLVQLIAKISPSGTRAITSIGWNYLQALAIVYYDSSLIFDYINFGLEEHVIEITDAYELRDHRENLVYSYQNFMLAEADLQVRARRGRKVSPIDLDQLFLNSIDAINAAFTKRFGFPLEHIPRILRLLGQSDIETPRAPLTYISSDKLVQYLCTHVSGLDSAIARKVIDFVSLPTDSSEPANLPIVSRMNTKKERLNVSPLIVTDGNILFGNQLCLLASDLWLDKLTKGDFPYTVEDKVIQSEIDKYRALIEAELERSAIEVTRAALGPTNVLANLRKYRTLGVERDGSIECGEIDILAANRKIKHLFILEVKHRLKRSSPYDNNMEFQKFFYASRSYLSKLLKKEKFVEQYRESILEYFRVSDKSGWQVKRGFVTLYNYPSAHHEAFKAEFIVLQELDEWLREP